MNFIAVAFLYPLLLAILSTGAGVLVERLGGLRFPAPVVPAVGFGALLVASQFAVLIPAIAPLTPWLLVVVALCGFALGWGSLRGRWLDRTGDWWLVPLAAVAAYVTVALPLIAAGRLTFPGYLLDTTAGFHLAAGEWMLHHGAPLPAPYPAYGAMLNVYYGHGYPSGGQVLLAATGWLSGQDLLWLYFPFQVFGLALSALVLAYLGQRAGLPRWAAAFAGWIASVPALVAAYAMMGSIKELTALPLLLLLGVLVVLARDHAQRGLRAAIPFAIAGGGAIGAIGPAAVVWIGAFGVAALLCASPVLAGAFRRVPQPRARGRAARRGVPALVAGWWSAGAALVAFLVVFSIPTLTRLGSSLSTAESLSGSNVAAANDPGNLLRPLRWVQGFGVWLGESHRVDPKYLNETYALIGVAVLCFALGVLLLVRRRRWSVLTVLAASLIVWVVLTKRGTEWTDAKVLMLTSPVVVLIALIGAFGDTRARRLQGLVLAGVLGAGVLASDALLYHGTNLAPTARFAELLSIGSRFSGQGPALVPDFDEYTFYALRKLNVDSPGFAGSMHGPFALFGGGPLYGHSYDVDDVEAPFIERFRLIVMRRSPRWSRPPGNFQLVWSGRYYSVWRRTGPAPRLHVPLGTGMQPGAVASCRAVRPIADQAMRAGAVLKYAARPPDVVGSLATADRTPDVIPVTDLSGAPSVAFAGPGRVTTKVNVPATATYGLWLEGNVDRPLTVLVDGRDVGAPAAQSGGDGNMIWVASVHVTAGHHVIELRRPGGGLAPGNDAATMIDGVYLQRVAAEDETVATIRPQKWRVLCGQPLDWIEVT